MENNLKTYKVNETVKSILKHLPGYNCGACGYPGCDLFAEALLKKQVNLFDCIFINRERFQKNRIELESLLKANKIIPEEKKVIGLLDGYEADFILKPIEGENSCREILHPFSNIEVNEGNIIRYRPLGCPITHFAEIIKKEHGLITVHIAGPCHRLNMDFDFLDVGICIVLGFEGIIEGKLPSIGETVRFLPEHCMMQKIHSGVVVQLEGQRVTLEAIDLKVWAPPVKG